MAAQRDPDLEALDRQEEREQAEQDRLRALGGCRYCRIHPNHPECTCKPTEEEDDDEVA